MGAAIRRALDPRLPGISPVYGDMAGLPPIVMQTAGDDPISVDADKIESRLCRSGDRPPRPPPVRRPVARLPPAGQPAPRSPTRRSPTWARSCATTSTPCNERSQPNEFVRRQSRRHHRSRLRHRQGAGAQSRERRAQSSRSPTSTPRDWPKPCARREALGRAREVGPARRRRAGDRAGLRRRRRRALRHGAPGLQQRRHRLQRQRRRLRVQGHRTRSWTSTSGASSTAPKPFFRM